MEKLYYYGTYSKKVSDVKENIENLLIKRHINRYKTYECETTDGIILSDQGRYNVKDAEIGYEDENIKTFYKDNTEWVFFKTKIFDNTFWKVKIKSTSEEAFLVQKSSKYNVIMTKSDDNDNNKLIMTSDEFEILEEMHTHDITSYNGTSSIGCKVDDNKYILYNFYTKSFAMATYNYYPMKEYYKTKTISPVIKAGDTVIARSECELYYVKGVEDNIATVYNPRSVHMNKIRVYDLIKVDDMPFVNTYFGFIANDKYYLGTFDIETEKYTMLGETYDNVYDNRDFCIMNNIYSADEGAYKIYLNHREYALFDGCIMCPECGEILKPKDLKTHKCKLFCENCGKELKTPEEIKAKRCTRCQKDFVNEYGGHWSKKKPLFEKPDQRNKFMHFGIELEMDQEEDDEDMFEDCLQGLRDVMNPDIWNPLCYFESDGSLSDYGIETVWNPKTIDWFRNNKDLLTKIFAVAKDNGYTSESNGHCGLHIHIDRANLGKRQELIAAKMVYFVNTFMDDYFMPLSRRRNLEYCYKTKIEKKDGYREIRQKIERSDRYVTVNCENKGTIEFRLWRGTLNVDTFLATIELTNAIIEFCRNISLNKLQHCTFDDFKATLNEETLKYVERRLGR